MIEKETAESWASTIAPAFISIDKHSSLPYCAA